MHICLSLYRHCKALVGGPSGCGRLCKTYQDLQGIFLSAMLLIFRTVRWMVGRSVLGRSDSQCRRMLNTCHKGAW